MKKVFNQPFVVRSLMALVFLLMPVGSFAQDHVTPDLEFYDPTTATNYEVVTEWIMNWTDRRGSYPALHNTYQLSGIEYSSSNTAVATINVNDGTITPIAPGTTTITASFPGEGMYDSASASYTLTYNDNREKFEILGVSFSEPTCEATYGDATVNTPSLEMGKLAGAAMTYASSTNSVATVDNAGAVTIKGVGSTVISASFAGDDDIKPGSVSYTLTVHPKEVGLTWGTTEFTYDGREHVPTATATGLVGNDKCTVTVVGAQTDAGNYTATASALSNANYELPADNTTSFSIAKAASSVTTVPTANTLTYTGSAQALVTAGAASGGTMQYSLDNQIFAETVPTGTNVGSYTVYYKVVGDANHENAEGGQVVVAIAKADATVTFASKTASGKMGEAFTAPKVTTSPADLTLAYTSSNGRVATVDPSTGAVTLVSAGETTITATFAGNDNYNAANDSYTLTVAKADAVSSDLSFATGTATATFGDATVTSPELNNPHQLPLTWSSSNEGVATVNTSGVVTIVGAGETVISAAFAGDEAYIANTISYTLSVNKADATVTFASKTASGKIGEAFTAPKVTTFPADLTLAYTSSNTKVATVDPSTGAVTQVSAGETTITATFAGNDNYNSASDSYTLVIEASDPTPEERLKLEPIVKEVDYTMDESDFINADGSEVDLSNTIVNNILFTLKNQESSEGDGYDTDEHCIVINTVTLTSTVNTLIANGVEPGSSDYASQFTGMTFIVPAGEGYIIVTSQEAESIYLMVKVGNDAPVAINMLEMGDYSIPYKSNAKTYVYLWNGGTNANGTRGKKSMVDMRVRRVAYKSAASDIQQVIGELSDDERWYNLNGLRITRPTKKGVYIHGNRKVVIK